MFIYILCLTSPLYGVLGGVYNEHLTKHVKQLKLNDNSIKHLLNIH